MRLIERLAVRIPALDCCPHPEMGDDPDTAYLPADTSHADYRGSTA